VSSKSDYTPEEWKSVVAAPYYAGSLIIMADINFTYFREVAALGKAIMASASESDSDLIKAVALDFTSKDSQKEIKPELEKMKGEKDPAALKQAVLDYVASATDLVSAKSAEDGDAYGRWLLHLAQKTAEGSKEGGVLGIGAVRVSDKEQAALDELAETLGVSVT
jgi:predicted Rossmann fold nucleotide-binding protein DprA/Smf involved in DNA uptake